MGSRTLLGIASLDSDRTLLERGDELAIYREDSGRLLAVTLQELDEDDCDLAPSSDDLLHEAREAACNATDLPSARVAIEKLLQALSSLETRPAALDSERMRAAIAHARGDGPAGSGSRLTKNGKDIAELGARRAFAHYFDGRQDRTTIPLGRFGHHTDPVEDFLREVDSLIYAFETSTSENDQRTLAGRLDVARTCTLPPTPRVIEARRRLDALAQQPA